MWGIYNIILLQFWWIIFLHTIHIHFHKIQHSSQWINISSSGRVYIVAHVAFNESWSTWLHLLIFQPSIPNLSTSQIHSRKSATKNLLQIQKLVHYPWWAQILFYFFHLYSTIPMQLQETLQNSTHIYIIEAQQLCLPDPIALTLPKHPNSTNNIIDVPEIVA